METEARATKLFNECQSLIFKMYQSKDLGDAERQTAISNAVLYFLKQQDRGVVPMDDYQNYKNVLYTTLRNEVLKQWDNRGVKKNMVTGRAAIDWDEVTFDIPIPELQDESEFTKQLNAMEIVKNQLSPQHTQIIQLVEEGQSKQYIADSLKLTTNYVRRVYDGFRRAVLKQYNTKDGTILPIDIAPARISYMEQIKPLLDQGLDIGYVANQLNTSTENIRSHIRMNKFK